MPTPSAESTSHANEVISLTTASAGDLVLVHFARRDGSTQMLGMGKQVAIDLFLTFKHAGEQFGLWDKDFELAPAESSARIPELEVTRAANQLIQQNPETAQAVAIERSRAAYALGDVFNFNLWERVAKAVVTLNQSRPDGLMRSIERGQKMAKMDTAFFPTVEGSMTSPDGQTFMLHVKRPSGSDLLLGFPHAEIPNIVENAAVQAAHGRNADGQQTLAAFKTSSFKVGRAPTGEAVLTMVVGRAGTINFLLPGDMPGQLSDTLQKLAN
jgi:hypothetical protein